MDYNLDHFLFCLSFNYLIYCVIHILFPLTLLNLISLQMMYQHSADANKHSRSNYHLLIPADIEQIHVLNYICHHVQLLPVSGSLYIYYIPYLFKRIQIQFVQCQYTRCPI